MKRSELSKEDLQLLETDFGEMDKVAEEKVAVANEMYGHGMELAEATADEFDKLAADDEEEEKKEEEKDEGTEKAASELGALIERGYFDGLRKLGSDRHQDELHYLYPFVEEKVAGLGAQVAINKYETKMASIVGKE